MRRLVFVAALVLLCAPVAKSLPCMNQVCDLAPAPCKLAGPLCQQCFRCIMNTGSVCNVEPGVRCPQRCAAFVCGFSDAKLEKDGGQAKLLRCLAQSDRRLPIPDPDEDHLQMSLHAGTKDNPLILVGVSHDAEKDFFAQGTVMNNSAQNVTAYRIGWLMYPKGAAKPDEREGQLVTPKTGIAPGATATVPAQGVEPKEILKGPHQRIIFYIAEVVLEDGTNWHADLSALEKKYQLHP